MLVLLLRMGVGLWAALCETLPAVIGDYPVDVRLAGDADEVASFNNVDAVEFLNDGELMKMFELRRVDEEGRCDGRRWTG